MLAIPITAMENVSNKRVKSIEKLELYCATPLRWVLSFRKKKYKEIYTKRSAVECYKKFYGHLSVQNCTRYRFMISFFLCISSYKLHLSHVCWEWDRITISRQNLGAERSVSELFSDDFPLLYRQVRSEFASPIETCGLLLKYTIETRVLLLNYLLGGWSV